MGLTHRRHDSLVTVWDEARLKRGHNDQSRRGHQCSETTLTGGSRFHISTPLGIEPSSREANGWTTGPVELCMNAVRLQVLHSSTFWGQVAHSKNCVHGLSINTNAKIVLNNV